MLYFFWGFLIFETALFAINNGKSRVYKKMQLLLIFLFMWLLLGWSRGTYDIEIGIARYKYYESFSSFTEIGYNWLVTFCNNIGLHYRTFFVICSAFELGVSFWFAEKNCVKSPIVWLLFMVYPMVIYFQYIRNLLALAFVMIALDALINKSEKYVTKYIVCILIASSIHFSSLFFLLYLPMSFLRKKIVAISTGVIFILLSLATGSSLFYDSITNLIGEEKTEIVSNSTSASGMFGRIFSLLTVILLFFFLYLVLQNFFKIEMDDEVSDLMFKINLLSFLFIPFTINFGVGFARIPTLLCPVNYVFFVNKISMIRSQKKRLYVYIIIFVYLFAVFFMNARNLVFRQLVIYPFFEENEFLM